MILLYTIYIMIFIVFAIDILFEIKLNGHVDVDGVVIKIGDVYLF